MTAPTEAGAAAGLCTPGEWQAHIMTREITVEAPCGRIIYASGNTGDESEIADALAISAAKNMLSALLAVVAVEQTIIGSPEQATYSERYRAAMAEVRSSIAKATGSQP